MYNYMIFQIEVFESSAKLVDIDANTGEEALERVADMYRNEEIVLNHSDFQDVEFNIIDVTK